MSKILYKILLLLLPTTVCGQEFLNDPNYIWGEGRAENMLDADQYAIEALANSIQVRVSSITSYNVFDNNGIAEKTFKHNTKLTSLVTLTNCECYIDENYDGGYRVIRYINKSEYVKERLELAKKYADWRVPVGRCMDKKVVSSPNVYMGYLYYAYKVLDDNLLLLLEPDVKTLMAEIKRKAFIMQKNISLYETHGLYFFNGDYPLYGVDADNIKRPFLELDAFYFESTTKFYGTMIEYWDGEMWTNDYEIIPKWKSLYKIRCTKIPRNYFTRRYSKDPRLGVKYRIPFMDVTDDGKFVKVDVPDDWYLVRNAKMFTPKEYWSYLTDDKERGFLTESERDRFWNYLFGEK